MDDFHLFQRRKTTFTIEWGIFTEKTKDKQAFKGASSTYSDQGKSSFSVERELWDSKDWGMNSWYPRAPERAVGQQHRNQSSSNWPRYIQSRLNGSFCCREMGLLWKRTQKVCPREIFAILSHHSTSQRRKWTWQSGGWWQGSTLEVHILKVYKKITGGSNKVWWCRTGYFWNQR